MRPSSADLITGMGVFDIFVGFPSDHEAHVYFGCDTFSPVRLPTVQTVVPFVTRHLANFGAVDVRIRESAISRLEHVLHGPLGDAAHDVSLVDVSVRELLRSFDLPADLRPHQHRLRAVLHSNLPLDYRRYFFGHVPMPNQNLDVQVGHGIYLTTAGFRFRRAALYQASMQSIGAVIAAAFEVALPSALKARLVISDWGTQLLQKVTDSGETSVDEPLKHAVAHAQEELQRVWEGEFYQILEEAASAAVRGLLIAVEEIVDYGRYDLTVVTQMSVNAHVLEIVSPYIDEQLERRRDAKDYQARKPGSSQ